MTIATLVMAVIPAVYLSYLDRRSGAAVWVIIVSFPQLGIGGPAPTARDAAAISPRSDFRALT